MWLNIAFLEKVMNLTCIDNHIFCTISWFIVSIMFKHFIVALLKKKTI